LLSAALSGVRLWYGGHLTSLKKKIRSIANKFGYDIVPFTPRRMGKDFLSDARWFLRDERPLIFDVGANVGQSIERFRGSFPDATIHAFEPSPSTFASLKANTTGISNIRLWNCALGASSGSMAFLENSISDMSSFRPIGPSGWGKVTRQTPVEVRTIDQVCSEENIERIDILKSDTQGFELEVLKGAEATIRSNRIGLVYVEVIFSEMYENQPTLTELYDFLVSRGFLLVTFYEFQYQRQLASWTDALFVHQSFLNAEDRKLKSTGIWSSSCSST